MTIFATLTDESGRTDSFLFPTWDAYHTATFSPNLTVEAVLPLEIHGRTYRDRQNSLRQLAIDIQSEDAGGLSYGELYDLQQFFQWDGRKLGLLREFRENAIC